MKTKQLIGIIVTGLVILVVGVTGVVSNVIERQFFSDTEKSGGDFFSSFLEEQVEGNISLPDEDFIGILRVEGEIGAEQTSYLTGTSGYNHKSALNYVEQMKQSSSNKGILLYIDSPGGNVYETDELYLKLMEYKKETGRPVWAYFGSQACSGGYYISMAADEIRGNRNGWTGSIGVIISLMNCKGLYDKLGIKEIDITSGKNKAMGAVGAELTKEQETILQGLVDEAYGQFVQIVAEGRQMDEAKVRELADGRIYSTGQAVENGLVDDVDTWENIKKDFKKKVGGSAALDFYEPESGMNDFFSSFFEKAEKILPKTEVELAEDIVKNNGNGVLKYYAK